jgi:hypothetical protein
MGPHIEGPIYPAKFLVYQAREVGPVFTMLMDQVILLPLYIYPQPGAWKPLYNAFVAPCCSISSLPPH